MKSIDDSRKVIPVQQEMLSKNLMPLVKYQWELLRVPYENNSDKEGKLISKKTQILPRII